MRVSRRGSQALALGAGVATLLAVSAPHSWAANPHSDAVTVVKLASASSVAAGALLTYTITATSTVAQILTITDTLPAGFNVKSASFVTNANPAPAPVDCTVAPATIPLNTSTQLVTCGPVGVTAAAPGNAVTATITAVPLVTGNNILNTANAVGSVDAGPSAGSVQTTVTGSPITCFGAVPTIVGTPGNDTITGTNGDDVIVGLGGNDIIDGGAGNDKICGGDGNDHLYGGLGNDSLAGGRGSDVVDGGAGTNTLRGDSDTTTQQNPWPGDGNHRHGNFGGDGRDGGRDTLICQRTIDTCDGGFRGNNDDNIIYVGQDPFDHNGDRNGRGHHRRHRHHGDFHDFAANKGTAPAQPAAKPGAKPAVKPAPAVAGTAPVAPKA
jgi:Ca2+-binding RTX toxin-like protein